MKRLAIFLSSAALLCGQSRSFSVVEATIPDMQAALKQKRVTSRELVTQYLARIATYEHILHAAVTVNPNALQDADVLDRERAAGKIRGPLHGIPIALKDNIHTTDMPTTGGALAFAGFVPPYEATLTKNLRDAGAIIIAKTTLIELANWVAGAPTPMPAYNAVAGFGFNPYDPRPDPRDTTGRRTSGALARRIQLRRRNRRQFLGGERRLRYRRVHHQSIQSSHAGRISPHHRPHQPLWRDSHHRRSRHRRSHGEDRHRCGDSDGRARKRVARSERCGNQNLHASAGSRLYEIPEARRLKGARIGIPRTFYYESRCREAAADAAG